MSGWSDEFAGAQEAVPAAKPNPYAPNTQAAKPTQQAMAEAWNANKDDPAKVYELMQQNDVGVNEVAKMLGVNRQDVAGYLNSGRSRGTIQSGAGDDLSYKEDYKYDEVKPEAQTREEFDATVEPWMLDAQGRFKPPKDGVHYAVEVMTPEEVWKTKHRDPLPPGENNIANGGGGGEFTGDADVGRLAGHRSYDPINLKWEPGYDNGGGVLGGMVRAVGNMGTEIARNPALMAALTAGVGSMMAPAAQAGATAGGIGTGGSAGIGSGTALGGGTASVQRGLIQSFASSAYARPAMNVATTMAKGGSLTDGLRAGVGTYAGGLIGSEVGSATGINAVGNVAGQVANSVIAGKDPMQALVAGGVGEAAKLITVDIPGFSELPASQRSAITSFVATSLKGKNPTAALIAQVKKMAINEITQSATTSGW